MRIGIDIGGTFTDFVLFDEKSGRFKTAKLLSTPVAPEQAVLDGLSQFTQNADDDIAIVHGSTVATNALLERKGAITALITTAGFRDVLQIGRQNRPELYNLFTQRREPLVPTDLRFEVAERVDHSGRTLMPLDETVLEDLSGQLRSLGVEAVAVSLLFSFLHPDHELEIGKFLRQTGFTVSLSCEVLPEFREYERTSTTVVNAYVSPIMDRYLSRLEAESGAADFRVMQSNGGSISARQARHEAVQCVLSGPAGGVVGARYVAGAAGFSHLLTFDMGGTSTDVSLCAGDIQVTTESNIDGMPLRIPVIDIHTVGSGGGSIAYVDSGGALRVGPESAGADPGPVCYAMGGNRPTVTDANLVLGRIPADEFLDGQMPLDLEAAHSALETLGQAAALIQQPGLSLAQTTALGVIEIANAHMERALRVISIQRGYDPQDFTLVSFGGAGSLHAVGLAKSLHARRILVPPAASTLSAFGMLTADVVKDYVQTVMQAENQVNYDSLNRLITALADRGLADITAEGVPATAVVIEKQLDMRYRGQSYELTVSLTPDYRAKFDRAHSTAFGHSEPEMPVEIVNLRVRAIGRLSQPPLVKQAQRPVRAVQPFDHRPVVLENGMASVPLYRGKDLHVGHQLAGPLIVVQPDTTIYVPAGSELYIDPFQNVIVEVRHA
jgi:N-methylhydantoinase A